MSRVVYHCFRATHPDWLDDIVAAVEAVPDNVFFDGRGQPIKKEVRQFDEHVYSTLSERFRNLGGVKRNVQLWRPERHFEVDILLATSPETLVEIEKGQLARLALDIIKIMSAILYEPEKYACGCLIVPVNYIELKLARGQTPYQHLTEHLLPLATPLLNISDSMGGYLLREFCVVGYVDPRGSKDTT